MAHPWDDAEGGFMPHSITVLTLRGALIDAITAFHDTNAPARQRHGPK